MPKANPPTQGRPLIDVLLEDEPRNGNTEPGVIDEQIVSYSKTVPRDPPEEARRATIEFPLEPPAASIFDESGDDYYHDTELDEAAGDLIELCQALSHLNQIPIAIRWKRAGGTSGGKRILGQSIKATSLHRHFVGDVFIVWLAADHARDLGLDVLQLERLLFDQLVRCQFDDKGRPFIAAADVQENLATISQFGIGRGAEDPESKLDVFHNLVLELAGLK